ncbi:oligosaccharide flippase family protein [Aliarcobacter butzleri]|uniref:oligosaccharide flippase family protein n=1 Tax=Aliarcobacter butzleri TaxID=28197 RepID=UPI0021B1C9D8|nr:oligosaccharide flippase family protein [Aliarcobacter butzleri]MCT7653100.1 oligosaccharide flippase family protein [Aliarcobacter butzleri]MDN5045624.1 oligosaccharide flippase family protein [Aliarcobacter butzleri]
MFKSEIISNIIHSYSSRIILIVLGLLGNVIITRSLGVENFGTYTLLLTIIAIATQFGNFGLHSANIYYVAQKKMFLGMLLKNSIWFSFFISLIVGLVIYFLNYIYPNILNIEPDLLYLALIFIPISLMSLLVKNLLVGIGEIKLDNRLTVYTRVITILSLVCIVTFYNLNIKSAIVIFGLGLLVGLIVTYIKLKKEVTYKYKLSVKLLKKVSTFGFKAYLSAIFAFLVLKSDLFFVNYYLTKTDLGHYSLAVSFIDYIYILPVVIGTVLFQKLSSLKKNDEKYNLMKKITFTFSGVYFVFLVIVYFLSEYLITFLYGEQFSDSVFLVNLLLIGIFFMGIETIQVQYLNTIGFPKEIIYYWIIALFINIAIILTFIEQYGLVAVAMSTVISYFTIFVLITFNTLKKRENESKVYNK